MTEKDFIFNQNFDKNTQSDFSYQSPSNIALVKYWGKKENQIPANPSISFTLNNCKTQTEISFIPKENQSEIDFDFKFESLPKNDFRPKIQKYLERILPYCSYLNCFSLKINTSNTFPHSSGIASSASGMAALSMNIMAFEKTINPSMSDDFFHQKASFLARLGSGSACRSIIGKVVVWGVHTEIEKSSDLYGVDFGSTHQNFDNFQDTILLVDKGEKQVSSTLGHNLMHNHPFSANRFEQAHTNLSRIKKVLESGDLEQFINIVESEALTLHAMMMTSNPYFILMKPNTLEIINKIWKFRNETKIPVCFTLDAGANVHLLYPKNVSIEVLNFIKTELVAHCQNNQFIIDEIGIGSRIV